MKSKKTLALFIATFLLPLVLAYGVLKLQWLPTETTNHGQFVQPELNLTHWASIQPKSWAIGVLSSEECEDSCLQQRNALRNLYMALGKNRDKVDLVLIGSGLPQPPDFKTYPFTPVQLKQGNLYLIDQMGLVLMEYSVIADAQENRQVQKGLIKDLKKLIKYARM